MASLIIVSGPNEGDFYPLGQRTLVFGRQENCPGQVNDDRVSRKHLQIRFDEGEYHALDMNSANGVWVNGRKVETETKLADNDEIEIGSSKIVFSMNDFPDRESALGHYKQRGQKARPTIEQ